MAESPPFIPGNRVRIKKSGVEVRFVTYEGPYLCAVLDDDRHLWIYDRNDLAKALVGGEIFEAC
jgi:hypothetical protein